LSWQIELHHFCDLSLFISSPWTARLVLALGAEAKLDVVPGAEEFAIPFSTLEDARVSA